MKNMSEMTAPADKILPPARRTRPGHPGQLDLWSGGVSGCARPGQRRRQALRSRAAWWFRTMRLVVDNAVEWKPAPLPKPEQETLDLRNHTEITVR